MSQHGVYALKGARGVEMGKDRRGGQGHTHELSSRLVVKMHVSRFINSRSSRCDPENHC